MITIAVLVALSANKTKIARPALASLQEVAILHWLTVLEAA
jgi:hypothetical protein